MEDIGDGDRVRQRTQCERIVRGSADRHRALQTCGVPQYGQRLAGAHVRGKADSVDPGRLAAAHGVHPLQSLFVRNGKVYAATWQTEPVRATSKVEGEGIRIEPQFAAWLPGIDSANNRDAKRVAPYADAKVRHVLSVANACKRSPSIEVVITLVDGRTQRVTLAKLPTSPAMFEDPEA
jgi:hypothetical protein